MTAITTQSSMMSSEPITRPMGVISSGLHFGIPALALMIGFHVLQPALLNSGVVPFYAYLAGVLPTLIALLVGSLIGLRLEGYPITREALASRFRFRRMSGRDWLWTGGLFIAMFVLLGVFEALGGLLLGALPIPRWLPDFLLPTSQQGSDPTSLFAIYEAAFGTLRGNWLALISYWLLILINVIGEEMWWRGYVLPRQEMAFGSKTWLIHGLLWWLFHGFKWWGLLPLLPVTLLMSFLAQRTQNSWPGLICHFIINGLGLIPITLAVLGVL